MVSRSSAPPALDVLLPRGTVPDVIVPEDGEVTLGALYAHPASAPRTLPGTLPGTLPDTSSAGAWVRATMVSTLDGGATGADGRSGSINDPADHRVFDLLRSLADVVLVGAGTVRAEGYRELPVRADLVGGRSARGQAAALELAVVTRSGDVPHELLDAPRPPLVVTTTDAAGLDGLRRRVGDERVIAVGAGQVDLAAAVALLAERGLPRVLTEGGPRLLGDLLRAGLVDDLCLTLSGQLVGGPAPRVVGGDAWLTPPQPGRCAHLLHSDGVLLGRWLLRPDDVAAASPGPRLGRVVP